MTDRDPDLYRTLMETLYDGVMVVGFDGSVRMANVAVCRMFGLDPAETVGRSFGELFIVLEGFDEFTQIILDAVAERGDVARRVTRVRAGGELRSLSVTTSCLTVGEARVALVVVVSDITEVRELRETELRQAAVIETQLGELRGAYRDLEARNEALSAMTRRVRVARGAAMLFVLVLFLAIGAWHVRPLDFFSATAALDAGPGIAVGDPGAPPTVTVRPRPFRSTIALRGHLAPGRVAEVVSPIESHVSAVHAVPGDRVAAGDPLVDLDAGQLAADHRRAQVDHIKARDRLVEIEDWENGAAMARARRALRRAKIALDDAERHLGRTAFLLEQGLVPASQHEDARRQRQNRALDVEEARRELEGVKAKGGAEARRVARLEARTAEDRLRAHREKLDLARVKAPIAGVVMAPEGPRAKSLTKGRPVGQGERMLSIADLERLSVVTSVDEVDVRKVAAGQQAWITGPGFPGLRVGGAVTRVSTRADPRTRRRNAPKFEVVVALDRLRAEARGRLRVGMSAYVTIVVHHRPAALLVPLGAVERRDGKAWLRVLAGDGTERRAVELGLTTLDSVEVTKGLSPGDRVVVAR